MLLFPKIEKITLDITISHFLLMFGYKLFSLYFPLFLVARGMKLPEVGYTYLLIYLPIALFAPIVGFLNHKINPAILSSLGVFGYALYTLGMISIKNPALFYLWQIILGLSAALFFVSARAILMSSSLENYDRAFGWFYSGPFYAEAFAPAIGALFIWKFNFIGVFILSLFLQFLNAIFCFSQLRKQVQNPIDSGFRIQKFKENYQKVFQRMKKENILSLILISFSVLLVSGFYHAFFILFLKDILNWSRNLILIYGAISSFLFLPVSLFVIHCLPRQKSEKNIFQGSSIYGISSIVMGILVPILNFWLILLIEIWKWFGQLMAGSGRSGLLSQELKEYPEEAGAIDTIFSPLGMALGALISGSIVGSLGYQLLFIFGGAFVLIFGILIKFAKIKI